MSDRTSQISALLEAGIGGSLTAEARAELNASLRHDPSVLADYCLQMRMHALLTWKRGLHGEPSAMPERKKRPVNFPRWRWLGAAAAAILVGVGALIFFAPKSADAATAALERMIAVAARGGDRSYRLKVLEGESSFQLVNGQAASSEGAQLHLGRGGQFVYECDLSGGTRRITGSDGQTSWDIIGRAPVHLSSDPTRFRHHLPGEQEGFTYLDPGAQLAIIREGYDVSLSSEPGGLKLLKAVKRSREFRGPREARVTFDEESGTIRSIDLIGLPQGRRGPSALRLTLTAETTFPPDFFSHTLHHEPGRRVEFEPDVQPPRRR